MSTQNIDLMSHPIYSPDLALLFIQLRFSTPEEAVDVLRMHVLEIHQSEWQKCFDNWFKRMQSVSILIGNILKNNKAIFDE